MKKMFEEFKKFIQKGNVIDMAVGVVVGGAFSKIVSSLVGDVIMPIVAIFTSKNNFTDLAITTSNGTIIPYGNFIQSIVDFLIVAFVLFLFIKGVNNAKEKADAKLKKKKAEEEPAPEPDSPELTTLKEIRDLLSKK